MVLKYLDELELFRYTTNEEFGSNLIKSFWYNVPLLYPLWFLQSLVILCEPLFELYLLVKWNQDYLRDLFGG